MIYIIQTYGSMLLRAMGQTLLLTLLSLVFAMIIGMIFALMNVGRNRVFNFIGTVYVDAVRGVPLIVLAYLSDSRSLLIPVRQLWAIPLRICRPGQSLVLCI